jgi:alginate O-acetyltransferase complex protein AlgI
MLLIASYVFYAWWDIRFLLLIIGSTVINYCCGILIADPQISKKTRITVSTWILLSCFLFVTVQWGEVQSLFGSYSTLKDWQHLFSWQGGWIIFGFVTTMVILLNLLHSQIEALEENTRRTTFFATGIVANLAVLGFFKYYNFFIDNMEWLIQAARFDPSTFCLNILLPIGISFYTFKGISYCMDTYQGKNPPARQYVDFAVFIAFFPALLAGPIDRASNLLNQISAERKMSWDQSMRGLHLFFYGLFKKVVIADGVVRTVNSVYGSTGQSSWIDVVVATVLFTIQIYCDFSGYTDMARGTAKLFGIDLMVNFNLPYFAKNAREFWSRWHISLSTWLRDYLYIPLGGNRLGTVKAYRNLMVTMVLGGLWHGAAWNFVLWGVYHGIVLCVYRAIDAMRVASQVQRTSALREVFKIASFFVLTCYGWLLFRAPSSDKIMSLTSTLIFDFGNIDFGATKPMASALFGLIIFICIEVIEYVSNGKCFYKKLPTPAWTALYASMIFCFMLGMGSESAQFIYFNF